MSPALIRKGWMNPALPEKYMEGLGA